MEECGQQSRLTPYSSLNSNDCGAERRYSRIALSVWNIWTPQDVASALRSLPGGEVLWSALEADKELGPRGGGEEGRREAGGGRESAASTVEEEVAKGHGETALLICAWCALPELMGKLLQEHGVNACTMDAAGRTPLHLASCAGDEKSVELLLKHGAQVEAWDHARNAVPLHCAACAGSVPCIELLLAAESDVNAGLLHGPTALFYAVQMNSVDCAKVLLEAGANPNTPQVFTETPLHRAAAYGLTECLVLLLAKGADVRARCGITKATALHLAAQDGNADCARLLLRANAEPSAPNYKHQTPLHLAALAQSTDTLELLMQKGANVNARDDQLHTPLHCAIVKDSRSTDCVRLLLANGANVNNADAFGYTPLHLAALNEFPACVGLLINAGADVMARTNGGVSALTFVVRRTPETLPCFFERLDSSVTLHDHDLGDADCELRLDFRTLLPPLSTGREDLDHLCGRRVESALLLGFIEVGMRQLLKHPLCETFLFLKWRRIRKYFLVSLAFHMLFVAFNTAYTIGVFYDMPDGNNSTETSKNITTKEEGEKEVPEGLVVIGYILLVLNIIFLAKEIFGIFHGWLKYIRNWENWLKLLIILSVFVCNGWGNYYQHDIKVASFKHHVAALGIVLTWSLLMLLIGRFPTFGVYVQMFTTVAVNFSKFLFAYCCLLVGFALGLGLLLSKFQSFEYPYFSLLKAFIMMSGELEYESIFFNDKISILYAGTTHILFLAFVLLVTVILTNLLVGLAVSDIQGLQKRARLNRLVRQAELVAHIESILFSRILHKIIPSAVLKPYLSSALMVSSAPYNRFIHIRPNDPRESRVPRQLIDGAYNLVASRSGRKTKMGETGPGSRRNAYKTWAMQWSLRSRAISIEDDIDDAGDMSPQSPAMKFLSSQLSVLAAESEARDSFTENLRAQMAEVKKSMERLTAIMGAQHLHIIGENSAEKKVIRMRSAPVFFEKKQE